MENVDKQSELMPEVFPFGKPRYREALRKLPLPEKVKIVVELQKMVAPILRARGENPYVWNIEV